MSIKIFAPKNHLLTQKAQIVAKYSKVDVELTPEFEMGKDNKTPEFLAKNPLGKVPVMETPQGCIWESNAIARYVARQDEKTQLFGANEYENALVEQWMDFATTEISLPGRVWLYPIFGLMENNQEATNKAKGDIRKVMSILDQHLADKTFLVGERLTLADITVATTLLKLFELVLDNGFRKQFNNLMRWYLTCVNQPNFLEVLGEAKLCTKMASAPKPEKKQEPKKEQKKQEPKKEKPAKEEKPAEEAAEEDLPKKKTNPMDLLPPSSFVLDEWKRFYSNNDGNVSMPWFWEHFDKEGWTIWFNKYKYNQELDSQLRTNNLIGGYHQRNERMIKYSFANNLILQKEGESNYEIEGCWLIRGTEIPELQSSCDDFALYEWTKVENTEDPAVRKRVEEFWNWEGDFEGRKFIGGKTFK